MDVASLKKLKVQELKDLLTARGLPAIGKKEELIARLAEEKVDDVPSPLTEAADPPKTSDTADHANGNDPAKVTLVTLDDVSAEKSEADRLKMRAERFGASLTEEQKKLIRASRFGESLSKPSVEKGAQKAANVVGKGSAPLTVGGKGSAPLTVGVDAETLKRRQERFGIQPEASKEPSLKKAKSDQSSKDAKSGLKSIVAAGLDPEEEERRKQRAARFS